MKNKNVIDIGKQDTRDIEELFEDSAEGISNMMSLIVEQQNIALALTKLILEYGDKDKKTSKEEVFEIYEDAFDFLKEQI
ncbi:MAG: hypothetical protein K0R52_1460 [Alphaproteobacteria bacterium]|jgi:hypothetical protein|nr:hypothetical protein [Alphaproteobacteria bacterium]